LDTTARNRKLRKARGQSARKIIHDHAGEDLIDFFQLWERSLRRRESADKREGTAWELRMGGVGTG